MQTFHHPLSPEEESHYLQKAKAGDLSARNILVEYNLRLVAHIVKKYQTGNRSTEDLISIGTIGLRRKSMDRDVYTETLARLRELFPGRDTITLNACAKYLHMDARTLKADKRFPLRQIDKSYIVPLIALAKYLA